MIDKETVEMLEKLKKEIERLGLQDNPSRTKLQELYDNKNMPHPNTYVYRFGTWRNTLRLIGINYNGFKAGAKSASKKLQGVRHAATWANMEEDEVISAVLSEIHSKGIRGGAIEYQEKRDKKSSPSLPTVTRITGYKWKDIEREYINRYGHNLSADGKKKWVEMDNQEIINLVIEEIKRIDSDDYRVYAKNRDRENTPSIATLSNKGITWGEIKNLYNKVENKND